MSKEFIERMYEPFTQERTAKTTSIPGSGLGLTIVKKLVDLMGGQISCSSQLGKGTTFTILLTIERIKDYHPPLEIDEKPIETLKNKRILLAEDNAINAEIATTILTSSGLLVESAANGKEAVDKFAASAPNYYSAILMDIRMPIMDGRQASLEIRGMPRPDSQLIPIIAMTADAYADDVRKCLEAGMDAHIAKPIQPELMLKELARLIK
jgi:CheY-like chemotaxis protein